MKHISADQETLDEISNRYLTINQAADELKTTPAVIRQYIKREILAGVQFGGKWKVSPASVEYYKDEGNRRGFHRPPGSKNRA